MEQLIGLDKLGEVGIFIVLIVMLFTQFAKMFLEYKSRQEAPSEDKIAQVVEQQAKSYDDLLKTMEKFFASTELRNQKIDKLYDMHNIRRNGGYAWYPYDQKPLEKAICEMNATLKELQRACELLLAAEAGN